MTRATITELIGKEQEDDFIHGKSHAYVIFSRDTDKLKKLKDIEYEGNEISIGLIDVSQVHYDPLSGRSLNVDSPFEANEMQFDSYTNGVSVAIDNSDPFK
ncbi:hypothetical protein GGF41_002414, partial [Coemansia sp. RSA 2531]